MSGPGPLRRLRERFARGGSALRTLFRPARTERELDDELRFHVEMETEKNLARGMDPAEARRRALVDFGGVERFKEQAREARPSRLLEDLAADARYAVRSLSHAPGFTLAAAVTIALGVGAATAIFSVADHVLLRPLPYEDAERVVTLWQADAEAGQTRQLVAPGNFLEWRDRAHGLEVLGLAEPRGFDLTGGGSPEAFPAWGVTAGFLEALGVSPVVGRTFREEEFVSGMPVAVLLSHRIWVERFGGDPEVVGRSIEIDGQPVSVVGVLPRWLEYPGRRDLWVPKVFEGRELQDRESSYMYAVGRLRPDVTVEAARADLDRVAASITADYPATNTGLGITTVPLEEQVLGDARPALLVLLAGVGLLLLIACTNVAGLLLARGSDREREIGVRAALGAPRGRLSRQLVAESAVLAAVGGAAGIALGWAGTRTLVAAAPSDLPRLDTVAMDGRVLAVSLSVVAGASLLFGIWPAFRLARTDPRAALAGGRTETAGRGRVRLRSALVIGETALALVLLVGAGLLGRSLLRLVDNDLGFRAENRVSLQLFLWDRNPTAAARIARVAEIVDRLEAAPGVESVGLTTALPFHPTQIDVVDVAEVEGRPLHESERPEVYTTVASPGYFRTMEIDVVRGRAFTDADRHDAPRVAVLSEAGARRLFPGEDPLGRRVTVGMMGPPLTREIVGVVEDVRPTALDSEPRPELYVPFEQSGNGSLTIVARVRSDAAAAVGPMQETVWEVDPEQTVYHATTLESLVSATLARRRYDLILMGAFSLIALILAGVGTYGLVSYSTRRRTPELGLRMALGAQPLQVVGMVVGQAVGLSVPGVLLGAAAALVLTRFMEHMLYGVAPTDVLTYAQVGALVIAVAVVGALVPARRVVGSRAVRALQEGG